MRLPRRGVVLPDPGFRVSQLVGPSQHLQIPLVAGEAAALRRVSWHGEQSELPREPPRVGMNSCNPALRIPEPAATEKSWGVIGQRRPRPVAGEGAGDDSGGSRT